MRTSTDIVAWQPVLTDHQAHTFEELARCTGRELIVFVTKTEDPVRKSQGWVPPSAAGLDVRVIPRSGWFRFVRDVLRTRSESIHLFGSPFEEKRTMLPLLLAVQRGLRTYLISEPYSPIRHGYFSDGVGVSGWVKARLRPALYRGYGWGLRGVEGVFAISRLAKAQYRRAGIPDERIHPFGYFVRVRERGSEEAKTRDLVRAPGPLRLVFVGSLIARKGVDILLRAMWLLRQQGVQAALDVYGPGEASRYAFDGNTVRYCGMIPFGEAQAVIGRYDALVVPSRYDGWGVVVNEALLAGVPVVCSDSVGAGAIVEKWKCGIVCTKSDYEALADAIRGVAGDWVRLEKMRRAASGAAATLTPAIAARYMMDVFEAARQGADRPTCPWYDA